MVFYWWTSDDENNFDLANGSYSSESMSMNARGIVFNVDISGIDNDVCGWRLIFWLLINSDFSIEKRITLNCPDTMPVTDWTVATASSVA